MPERFLSWQRSPIFTLVTPGSIDQGRLQAGLPLTLVDIDNPAATRGGSTPFELLGPGDVRGVVPAAITARVPAPGAWDAIETKAAHVEFAEADLPWRYSPMLPDAGNAVRPWLVLVIGRPGTDLSVRRDGRVELRKPALPDLALSGLWAHVHALADGRAISRLLCPIDMQPDTGYVAALVPAFRVIGDEPNVQIVDAWDQNTTSIVLQCYDAWSFQTGPKGDFADLAGALRPRKAADIAGFAEAAVVYRMLPPAQATVTMDVNAALMRIPPTGEVPSDHDPAPAAVTAEVASLASAPRTYHGRWVLTFPDYSEPWPSLSGTGWRQDLRNDPRRRGVAGLGLWAGIEWQDKIADAAAAQAGALAIAAQRIRHLTLALAATRGLWTRRLPPAGDPLGRLAILAPVLSRLPAGGTSVLQAICGRTPRMTPELFSSAAQRVLRPGPARARLAKPGATRFAAILQAANRCPPAAQPDPLGVRLLRGREPNPAAWEEIVRDARERARDQRAELELLLQQLPSWIATGDHLPPLELLDALDPGGARPPDLERLRELIRRIPREPETDGAFLASLSVVFSPRERERCMPLDLSELGRRVAAGLDPTVDDPLVVRRVLGGITGLKHPKLAPPELEPELDLPLWKFLDQYERNWLLPGVGDLPKDSVVVLQTNPVFVDAFMVGANHQTLGELRWRNLPVSTGWTPMRRFWQRISIGAGKASPDILPIAAWAPGTVLGAQSHQVDPANGAQLVIVFRTELFRRFPATVVYITPADLDGDGEPDWAQVPDFQNASPPRTFATMTGGVGDDVVFFGFPVPPVDGRKYWVVLEEPPPGYRFYTKEPLAPCDTQTVAKKHTAKNGAEYAQVTFALPVRVLIGNLVS